MAASSSSFFSMGDENEIQLNQQQQLIMSSSPPPPAQPQPPSSSSNKKRRNQPGNPNPDAEIIALSPKTLMATNRFVCEVCNKGFQREQNLQLHRRGHNLPWKLRQKSTKEVKRKVYLCPEPTCVHHDPARALGDLTGIKKHFSRKHGEKKYKCEKCSKKYAVQSDWKAHSKTCGTREYRCDCGTLFSRRDSFITHRAFCDALAQESVRNLNPPSFSSIGTHLLGLSQITTPQPDHHHHVQNINDQTLSNQDTLRLGTDGRPCPHFETLVNPGFRRASSSRSLPPSSVAGLFLRQQVPNDHEDQNQLSPHGMMGTNKSTTSIHGLMQLPQFQINNNANFSNSSTTGLFNLSFFPGGSKDASSIYPVHHSGGGGDPTHLFSSGDLTTIPIPSLYSTSSNTTIHTPNAAHISATTLLQKATQLGSIATTNNNTNSSFLKSLGIYDGDHHPSQDINSFGSVFRGTNNNNNNHLQDLVVNSIADSRGGGGSISSSASTFGSLYTTVDQNHDGHHMDGYKGLFHADSSKMVFDHDHHYHQSSSNPSPGFINSLEQAGRLTRDFLGVGEVVRNVREKHNGVEMSAVNLSQGHSTTSQSHSFGEGSF